MITRRALNAVALPVMLLMVASLLDAVLSLVLTPENSFSMMAGGEVIISGTLDKAVPDVPVPGRPSDPVPDPNAYLKVTGELKDVKIVFEELSGTVWRARVSASAYAQAGTQVFLVHDRYSAPEGDATQTSVTVFADEGAYRQSFHSFLYGCFGVGPWWFVAATFPLTLLLLAGSFHLSGVENEKLRQAGIASIYKLARRDGQWEVVFGMGMSQGIRPGDELGLLDENFRHVGVIQVLEVRAEYSAALVDGSLPIKPGYFIRLTEAAERRAAR